MSGKGNDPIPVETRLRLVLAVLAREMTVAEAARRHGVSTESINRWRDRFVNASKRRWKTACAASAGVWSNDANGPRSGMNSRSRVRY